jgi:hypothetical protein
MSLIPDCQLPESGDWHLLFIAEQVALNDAVEQRAEAVGVEPGIRNESFDGDRVNAERSRASGVGHQMAAEAIGEPGRVGGEPFPSLDDASKLLTVRR